MKFSAEKLAAAATRRRRAEAALDAATEGALGASQEALALASFDWEIPGLDTPHLITFLARVRCQGCEHSLRIPIDVARLAAQGRTADLERLQDILAIRHAGLDDRHSLVKSVEWMLSISLEQTKPELSPAERQLKVRRLLLIESPFARKQEARTSKS
jgi:hypothetical protein